MFGSISYSMGAICSVTEQKSHSHSRFAYGPMSLAAFLVSNKLHIFLRNRASNNAGSLTFQLYSILRSLIEIVFLN